jgi:hypothetical protein
MDKSEFTQCFNNGFRTGANDRAAAGFAVSDNVPKPEVIPAPPGEFGARPRRSAWSHGYAAGYQVGASDAELRQVEVPGANGLISGMSQEFLEQFDFFGLLNEPDAM